jgi:hypothetical protein
VGGIVLVDTIDYFPARYVKLTITGCHDYEGDWASIIEFRIFGNRPSLGVTSACPEPSFRLYPNPALERVYMETGMLTGESLEVQIWNMQGKMVLNRSFPDHKAHADMTREIDVSGLEEGIYFVRVLYEKHMETEKLIIHK